MNEKPLAHFFLRMAIASVFIYAAVASFINPNNWIGYFPSFLQQLVPPSLLLNLFSIYELGLSAWLLLGKKPFFAAVLAMLTLSGIIIFNLTQIDIVFRDLAIIFAALSLAIYTRK